MKPPFDPLWLDRLPASQRAKVRELLRTLNDDTERDFSQAPIARFLRETTPDDRRVMYCTTHGLALPSGRRAPPTARKRRRPERTFNWRASRWAPSHH